jgi:hypothetical protein
MPGVSGVTVAHYAHAFAAGASAPGIPAPSDWKGKGKFQQISGGWRREIAKSCLHSGGRHCEEHSCPPKPAFGRRRMRRSNPASFFVEAMDCFVAALPCANASRLSQAMTLKEPCLVMAVLDPAIHQP